MNYRSRTVKDIDGQEWEVTVTVEWWDESGFTASLGEFRKALPGPVRERLIDELRDDVEALL